MIPLKHNKPTKITPSKYHRVKGLRLYTFTHVHQVLWDYRLRATKRAVIIFSIFALFVSVNYGTGKWYALKHQNDPLVIGATFVPNYARYFELDPKETLSAMITDLDIKRFRLVSYWKDIESTEGTYNFDELDWQFDMIEQAGGQISLAIGLRQPRWPECHGPNWAMEKPMEEWSVDLKDFMGAVIERYKDRPSLVQYQLENEFFLTVFGECPDFTRSRLVDEYNFVKEKDPNTELVISRSNNGIGFPIGEPTPDKFAVSVYKRVWDKTLTKRYFEYPFPAWFYGMLAGGGELLTGKELFIHELQTEAWLAEGQGYNMKNAPIEELYESLSPERLEQRFEYGVATGMRTIDVWGVEWWYQMKTKRNSPELWDTAKKAFNKHRKVES